MDSIFKQYNFHWSILTKVADTELPTTGYKLYRDDGNDGQFSIVYDGTHRPGQLSYISTGLITGTFYRFKVLASNFNGDGSLSDEVLIPACMPPSGLAPPIRSGGTSITIILEWTPPEELNGCLITGFNIYQGTALGTDDLLSAQLIYSLGSSARSQTITYTSSDTGNTYVYQLEVTNAVGSVKSGIIETALAGLPTAPPTGPQSIASETNTTQITVEWTDISSMLNGGTLKALHLQMNGGGDGNYIDLIEPEPTWLDPIYTVVKGIKSGTTYLFRYCMKNENGWGDFSPVTLITAATVPSSPPKPVVTSATSSTINLSFSLSLFDGGATLTTYQLYVNDWGGRSEPTTLVTGYTGATLAYSFSSTDMPTITSGSIWVFKFRVTNSIGDYADSEIITVALADSWSTPTAPYQVSDESNETSITLEWAEVSGTQSTGGDILGYSIIMRKADGGTKQTIIKSSALKWNRKFTVTNLQSGTEYLFAIKAYQLNGFIVENPVTKMIAWGPPQYLLLPMLTSSSTTQLILSWQPPAICGDWAVIEYALFMDDGNGGLFTEIDSSTVIGSPQIFSHTATTFPTSSIWKSFIFQLKVFKLGGSTTSDTIGFPLAPLPTSPSSGPIVDLSVSSNYAIKVDVPAISTLGGLPITSYSIEVDDGAGGYFYALYGILTDSLSTTYTISTDIQEGQTYRFRYRLKNEIGWSDYSPVTYAKAMAVPDVPPAPEYVSSSDTSITFLINFCSNLNGAIVDYYELYRDQGSIGSTFKKVTSYGGDVSTFTFTTSSDTALVTGLLHIYLK